MPSELTSDDYLLLQTEPVDFIELAFGDELTDCQRVIVNSVRDHKYMAVRSCHGSGKTSDSADIALWFLNVGHFAYPLEKNALDNNKHRLCFHGASQGSAAVSESL
jgi:hypothetical protein